MESNFAFLHNMHPLYTSIATRDVDSVMLEDDILQERQNHKTHVETLKKLLRLSTAFLILMVVVVTVLLLKTVFSECSSSKAIGFQRLVPKMPETTIYFREAHEYSDRPSPKTDEAWNNLLPPGRGYVFVDDAEHYLPEPGETTPWGQIYSVALFHQLHCLGAMRDHYWKLLDSILNHDEKLQDLAEKLKSSHHINHCYDYIRQSLQCSGDMSLEWPRTEPDGRRFVVDGWNIPHQCKSWDAIMEYMDHAHYNGSQRSDIAKKS